MSGFLTPEFFRKQGYLGGTAAGLCYYKEKRYSFYNRAGIPDEHNFKVDLFLVVFLSWFFIPMVTNFNLHYVPNKYYLELFTIISWVIFLGILGFVLSAVLAIFYPNYFQNGKIQ